MNPLDFIPHQEPITAHRPWPRAEVGEDGWLTAIDLLATGHATLLGFWGEASAVHLALLSTGEDQMKAAIEWTWGAFTDERSTRITVET